MLILLFFQIRTSFVKFEFYSNFVYAYGRVNLFWFWPYTYSILYNMAFMWWCSILGPGRILLLLIACFITFYVRRALRRKTTATSMYYLLYELLFFTNWKYLTNFNLRFEYRMYAKRIWIWIFETKVPKFELRLMSLFILLFSFYAWLHGILRAKMFSHFDELRLSSQLLYHHHEIAAQ